MIRSQDHSHYSLYLVQGQHLPKIEDNIDNALGLAVFYRYLRTATLTVHHMFTEGAGVFTPKLFAHYLFTKRLLVPKCRLIAASVVYPTAQTTSGQLRVYNILLYCKYLFTSDLVLCKLLNNSGMLQHPPRKNLFPPTSAEVIQVQLLKQDSIENAINWTEFSRMLVLERSIAVSSITGFLPLYLYICGLYDRCMKLCLDNIHAASNDDACRMLRIYCTYREFIQLMDSDVVSLLGLTLLVDRTAGAQTNFTGPMTVSQLSLTLYLLTQSQSKFCCNISGSEKIPEILDWIANAEENVPRDNVFDRLMLKLTRQKSVAYVMRSINRRSNFLAQE